jgi:rsbT co-antagonist protein RsbR
MTTHTNGTYTDDVTLLRQRIVELEQRCAAAEREVQIFKTLTDASPLGMIVSSLDEKLTYANPAAMHITGYDDNMVGMLISDFSPNPADPINKTVNESLQATGQWSGQLSQRRKDGSTYMADMASYIVTDHHQQPLALVAITSDLTLQQAQEKERIALQEQVIQAQQAALRELSTPLIPISEGVVVMPLVGSIDSSRAQQIVETLLTGVSEARANTVILDITGVPVVDTQVANALLRAAQAVKLLGAQVVLTGIRPEVAQTLVGLGVDLSGITTLGTLQSGVATALARASNGERTALFR